MKLYEKNSLPTWAAPVLANGDATGISEEDEKALDAWLETLPPGPVFSYGEEEYFTHSPAFGLPATCIVVEIFTN